MKKQDREIYRVLTDEVDYNLCSFCKYNEGSCGNEECNHPLPIIEDITCDMSPGCDCWGFRPRYPVSLVADIVGVILANGFSGGSVWWQDEEDRWRVAGVEGDSF